MMPAFLFILIYFASSNEAKEIHIPLCAAWRLSGTVAAGSTNGIYGNNRTLLNQPTAVVMDENDTMYVVDSGNNRLMKYENGSRIGEQVNISTDTIDGRLRNPQDIVFDESGAIYITEAGLNRVIKWNLDAPTVEILANLTSPTGIYLNENATGLYVVGNGRYPVVMLYDLLTYEGTTVAGDGDRQVSFQVLSNLYNPVGIYVDENENIFVAESGSNRVTKWSSEESIGQRVAGTGRNGSTLSALNRPTSIILDDAGIMYITDCYNNRILRWRKDSTQGECIVGCSGNITNNQLNKPYDITFDSKWNLLVVERYIHRVKRFDFYFDVICMRKYCSPPIVSIEDHQSSIIRSQSMTFAINAILNCHIWETTDMNCTVIACFPGDISCIQTTKLDTIINSFLVPDSYNMLIPPFGLAVGTYNFSCMITMTATGYNSTINTTLQIIRSPIAITLLPLGKSTIRFGYQQRYTFRPNILSNNIDNEYRQNIRFVYYCRKYPNFNYSMVNGVRLSIDDDIEDPKEPSCFNSKVLPQAYLYDDNTKRSSLTIMNGSLQINTTYEFYVEMYNNQGLIDKSDTVLVEIQLENSFLIEISILLNTLTLDEDYQLLNPSTQLILESSCINCYRNTTIQWKIYQGTMNNSLTIKWEEYIYDNKSFHQWFYGINSSLFTVTNNLFSSNKHVNYWQFQAIYTYENMYGSGLVQLKTNHPPLKKECSINPTNGHTSQLYTVICSNWTDLDGIKDYFLYVTSPTSDIQMSIAHSLEPVFNVYLPSGDPKSGYGLYLVVHVRDMLGAWTESNVTRIIVKSDQRIVNEMLNFTEDNNQLMKSLLSNGDQNQLINSFSTIINQMALYDQETLMNNSQVRISDLIISTFDTDRAETYAENDSDASGVFIKGLKSRSTIREYLLNFYKDYSMPTTIEEIVILSSTIKQLTDTTSEWSRASLTIASKICNQLASVLHSLSRNITFEQITLATHSIAQCTSNVFTGVNAPLQRRGVVLDHDVNTTINSESENNYDDEEYNYDEERDIGIPHCSNTRLRKNQICKEISINDNNSTIETLYDNLNLYYRQILADELRIEIDEALLLLAESIRCHLNIHQEFPVMYPVLRMLVEQIHDDDLEDKTIDFSTRNASIYFPKNLNFHQSHQIGVLTSLLILAPAASNTDVGLSTAITLTILDDHDQHLKINTSGDALIEIFIPRDINLPIPRFIERNMTQVISPTRGTSKINRQFFIYYVNITQTNPDLTISVHFELKPLNKTNSYVIIYKFDEAPVYNSTHTSIDGSTMFCSENLVDNMNYYQYYLDNIKTAGHKSLLIGIRELYNKEVCSEQFLPKITDQPYSFSNNYDIRMYTSGCYYFDGERQWKSDGMKVGPKTNLEYTHCYSNHT